MNRTLVSVEGSRIIDREAQTQWGFNSYALIEAAGRNCAQVLARAFPRFFSKLPLGITVLAGPGNNGADALVMVRSWLLSGITRPGSSKIIMSRFPSEDSPSGQLFLSLRKMGVAAALWDKAMPGQGMENPLILDGVAGTGLRGPLEGPAAEMIEKLNTLKGADGGPLVVSVDLPSGLSDEWRPGMPIVKARATLAIEPQKHCLYKPSARPWAGTILPVGGIFPRELAYPPEGTEAPAGELLDWVYGQTLIPAIPRDIHKYQRGTVEIRAGSLGATGAAFIAARGAQAIGAGLTRLIVDPEIYPVLASRASGIMVSPEPSPEQEASPGESSEQTGVPAKRFRADALLLGPGWGRGANRGLPLEKALEAEQAGTPLILDADGIALAKDLVFHGNALLTPHTGEFSVYSGVPVEDILYRPVPLLLKTAAEKRVFILLKSHVMIIAAPDGRWGLIDGGAPNLASGGTGDLLAGFCAALAARMFREGRLDLYACAGAAASLLIHAGKSKELAARFTDPLEIASRAADEAGRAWLGREEWYG